jgi:hypothetical protein
MPNPNASALMTLRMRTCAGADVVERGLASVFAHHASFDFDVFCDWRGGTSLMELDRLVHAVRRAHT